MKTARELYESDEDDDHLNWSDYDPMLAEFGDILLQVDDDDYQGDSRLIYIKDGKYGYLQFGWGSCSGCDALRACEKITEVQELMDELQSQIKWFDDVSDALLFFKNHDWEGDYSFDHDNQREFINDAIKLFEDRNSLAVVQEEHQP